MPTENPDAEFEEALSEVRRCIGLHSLCPAASEHLAFDIAIENLRTAHANAIKAERIEGVKHALVQISVASAEGVRLKIINALWNEIYPEPGRQSFKEATDEALADALKRREADVWREAAQALRDEAKKQIIRNGKRMAEEFEQRAEKAGKK